jgi:hypothetical protein
MDEGAVGARMLRVDKCHIIAAEKRKEQMTMAAWGNALEALLQHRNHEGTGEVHALHANISPNIRSNTLVTIREF